MEKGKTEVQVNFPQELQGGRYSNNVVISHTRDEFIMDFMFIMPPAGAVVSRVIVSPGHMKRFLLALKDNVEKYEKNHGPIEVAEGPKEELGFMQ
jgi:hypothetical protein